jgi:tetratricopeptide (TPR) repeat protein
MRRAVRWAIVMGALGVVVPASSRAEDHSVRDARMRFEEGVAYVRVGDFEGARLSFAKAYEVLREPDILWNLALSEQKSGHLVDALAHFRELDRVAKSERDRASAKNHVSELMAQTGHIEVLAPAGAQVTVDGTAAGVAPLAQPVDVFPGKHHVEALTAQGTKAADIETVAGQVAHVSFTGADTPAEGAGAAPMPTTAPIGPAQPVSPALDDGAHAAAGISTARIVTVAALGGLALVGVGLGINFGLSSSDNASEAQAFRATYPSNYCSTPANAASTTCTQWNDAVRAQDRDLALSEGFYIAGAVLAAGAVATWFLWPKQSAAVVVPSVGPAGAGLDVVGRF